MNDRWQVYLYGIMWGSGATREHPDNLRVTVYADDRQEAIECALEEAADEFGAMIEGTEQIEVTHTS